MQIIEVEFTARQFHATPWDAHVNEGRVEWPPSPWRLLRALIAVGYSKLNWQDTPPPAAETLLHKLAACRPEFGLPVSTETHTRHYMPVVEGKKERRAKVFDTFLRFPPGQNRMRVVFDCQLDADERELLKRLVEGLAYLGRAESWVDARLLDQGDADTEAATMYRWSRLADQQDASDRIRLLAPLDVDSFSQWREDAVSVATRTAVTVAEETAQSKGRKLTPAVKKKAVAVATAPFPKSLVQALQNETSDWQKQGWQRPPGSQWVDYEIPGDLYARQPLKLARQRPRFQEPEAILLAVDGEGKRGTLRPTMRRALPLMELLHAKAVWCAETKLGLDLEELSDLTGMTADKRPLQTNHAHAHWIPLSLFDRTHIDHVLVYAPEGLSHGSVRAIGQLRTAYSKGICKLAINLVGQGDIADLCSQLGRVRGISSEALDVLRPASQFESATPLVFRKYLSNRGKKKAENQIREELVERGLPEPTEIGFWTSEEMVQRRLKGFVLRRQTSKPQPPFERSFGVTIRFAEVVHRVPISLGYASHYGLGLLRAVE